MKCISINKMSLKRNGIPINLRQITWQNLIVTQINCDHLIPIFHYLVQRIKTTAERNRGDTRSECDKDGFQLTNIAILPSHSWNMRVTSPINACWFTMSTFYYDNSSNSLKVEPNTSNLHHCYNRTKRQQSPV